jgi:hypothetical protein
MDIELDEVAGFKIQDHRRSSITIWEAGFPFAAAGFADPAGFPPFQLALSSSRAAELAVDLTLNDL